MMKKLLYVAAIAVLFTSCSVDSLQDENSIDQEINAKATSVYGTLCFDSYLINDLGEKRGHLRSYIGQDSETLTITLKTYNNWKIKKAKMFFGPEDLIDQSGTPSLFDLGKYDYSETFVDGIYTANFTFSTKDIEDNFVLLSLLVASNGVDTESVTSLDGDLLPEDGGSFIVRDLVSKCL